MLYFSMTYTLYESLWTSMSVFKDEIYEKQKKQKKLKGNEIMVESTQRYETLSVL